MSRRALSAAAAVLALAAVMTAPTVAAAAPVGTVVTASSTAADQVLGTRLVNKFFGLLVAGDKAGLAAFLSPAFQVQRANGVGSDKAAYLANPPAVEAYELSDLVATRAGTSLVVRYTVTASETIDGQLLKKDPAPRLSVFRINGATGKWQLLAHANFNAVAPAS